MQVAQRWIASAVVLSFAAAVMLPSHAAVIILKSGAQYEGNIGRIGSVSENPLSSSAGSDGGSQPVAVVDDELRFVFVPNLQVANYAETPPKVVERIRVPQRVAEFGQRIPSVGSFLNITPFDSWGRRTVYLADRNGPFAVFQGITEITPLYTKVEGLQVKSPYVWDLRMATSSLPPETLSKILAEVSAKGNVEDRLKVVRLYIQAQLYRSAVVELESIRKAFPELEHLREQETRLVQLLAQQALTEIELRRDAGQHQRAMASLQNFPTKDVAGETLLKVRDMYGEYESLKASYDKCLSLLDQHLAAIADEPTRTKLTPICTEIKTFLSVHNLDRMADYLRLSDDASMSVEQKLSLAISGWLLGGGAGIDNLAVTSTLPESRDLIRTYLASPVIADRLTSLEKLKTLEGGTPTMVAKLLAMMIPPIETPIQENMTPGAFKLSVPGIEPGTSFSYLVQLPPEYDPTRRYPCVVTLNGGGTNEKLQLEWWSGQYLEKAAMCAGQASRRGYIVIAPTWMEKDKVSYEFTLREHAAVLSTVRDAMKRFSIDTDRVFLSGHFTGADAAWDIGVAHPDMWAGVVLFVPHSDRYIAHYTKNAKLLPFYVVGGEFDGGTAASGNWIAENATELDRYLRYHYDCTVVMYRGRGREAYEDEVQRVFEWMQLPSHRRNLFPKSFEAVAMRPWDNFFYWLEVDGYPSKSMLLPQAWTDKHGTSPTTTIGEVLSNGRLKVDVTASSGTVWLSPELVNFDREFDVAVNGKALRAEIKPNTDVILEDVRTRCDRQHPFWSKVEWPERRGSR